MILACYNIVTTICGEGWDTSNQNEINGGMGVAIMLAYMRGVSPRLHDLSNVLEVEIVKLERAYNNLQSNGAFVPRNKWRNDPVLAGNLRHEDWENQSMRAWAGIAALSSGFSGKGILEDPNI